MNIMNQINPFMYQIFAEAYPKFTCKLTDCAFRNFQDINILIGDRISTNQMKPSVFTIDVSGRSGRDGRNAGTNGYDQPKGRNASTPSPGQNGLNGESPPHATNGLDGQSGESGENAPDCKVMLYGEPKHLILEGNIQKLCNSYTLNEKDKILIKVRGGNGGNGTPGGRGGHGGDGGTFKSLI